MRPVNKKKLSTEQFLVWDVLYLIIGPNKTTESVLPDYFLQGFDFGFFVLIAYPP